MRFSIVDLIVFIICIALPLIAIDQVIPSNLPFRNFVRVVGATFGGLVATSVLYRALHWFPLLLPRCPVCRDPNLHYSTVSQNWPLEVVKCAICDTRIELCAKQMKVQTESTGALRFLLLWPYSFGGRWKRE